MTFWVSQKKVNQQKYIIHGALNLFACNNQKMYVFETEDIFP